MSEWLLEHAAQLGCRYACFDLERPSDEGGGTLNAAALLRQTRLLVRYVAWLRQAPPVLHHAVALTRTGLVRDAAFIWIARLMGRRVIAHVHGSDLGAIRARTLRAWALGLIDRASVETVTIAPSLAAQLGQLNVQATAVFNPLRTGTIGGGLPSISGRRHFRLLFVGTYGIRKGCPELVRAFAHARVLGLDDETTLVFAGKEEHAGEEAALRALVGQLGLNAHVAFPGVMDRYGLARLYAESSAFCLPSHREGLPMALLEAMAAGLPSITTSVGGIADVVEHDVTGILVEPGHVDTLAAAMVRLASDATLRRRLGVAARERVLSLAGEEVIAEQWRELYARHVPS